MLTVPALCLSPSLRLADSFRLRAVYMLGKVMCVILPSVLWIYSPCC